jgi:hypothetical protein
MRRRHRDFAGAAGVDRRNSHYARRHCHGFIFKRDQACESDGPGIGAPAHCSAPGNLLTVDAAAAPQLWISCIPRLGGAADSGWLLSPNAEWKPVASHTSAVQVPPAVILNNKDDALKRAFQSLTERHIGLALELCVLVRTDQCSLWTKAFSDPSGKILERVQRLGDDLKYAVMDDQLFFGHRFSAGLGVCLEAPARLAQHVAEKIRQVRTYFRTRKSVPLTLVEESSSWIDELMEWADVYQQVTGEPLGFFHADVAWSHAAIRNLAPLARAARHIPFGIIYNADDTADSDETWTHSTRQRIAEIGSTLGLRPYAAIFRSWARYPSRLLPEMPPGILSGSAPPYATRQCRPAFDGRLQMKIPQRIVEAASDIHAYFPRSASLGSQTVTVSQ